jgi:hypothetical protein
VLVVFVKTTVRRRGDRTYTYLSLVESVRLEGRMTHRTLLRLGEVSELAGSGQLDRIIAALRTHAEGTWCSVGDAAARDAPGYGAVAAAHTYFGRLGLESFFSAVGAERGAVHLADTVFVLAANRLVRPWSKRRTILSWLERDVTLPDGVAAPSLDQCYRALDAIAEVKERLESHLYGRLCDLTNLDLRLVCYDLTSTYFETDTARDARFASKAFGYSRDHRSDRPQVVIGLLVTGDGIPIAHHVFAGNTRDSTTLPAVMADYQARFGVGRIALVADRGLISEANLAAVGDAGFDHVIATRLHRDPVAAEVLTLAARPHSIWTRVDDNTTVCDIDLTGRRYVVVDSAARQARDDTRTQELLARTAAELDALAERVGARRLVDPAKIGAAADRILRDSGVARCFATTIGAGRFAWDYDAGALHYELNLLQGRYIISTSLTPADASAVEVFSHYRSLTRVERRFRVLKDFLALRPVYHYTENRVRGHIALCVLAAVIEAVMGADLERAGIADPDIASQVISPRRALAELDRIRRVTLDVDDRDVRVITKRNATQAKILAALGVNTSTWDKADIT